MRKSVLLILVMLLLLPGAALANDDNPTVAFLRLGVAPYFMLTDNGVLDVLQVYGYINEDERAQLDGGSDLHGENINLLYRDAGFDFGNASLMVEDALDEGADILITVSNEVGMLAANAISELDDPPALIFAIVTSPYDLGLAASRCVKAPYIGGTEMAIDWDLIYRVPFMQVPDIDVLGVIGDPGDPAFQQVQYHLDAFAADTGVGVEVAGATSASDMALAGEQLVSAGADLIYLAPRTSPTPGIPAVIKAAYGVPVSSAIVTDISDGVTLAGGFEGWYREGMNAARLAIGVLRGDIDLASTGIAATPAFVMGVNLQSADEQGIEIRPEVMEFAKYVVDMGEDPQSIIQEVAQAETMPDMPMDERIAADLAFLESLHCTPEMIAEEMAALES